MSKTKSKSRTDWHTSLNIPEGRQGIFAVEHEIAPVGRKMMLNNLRTSMFGQKGPSSVEFDHPTHWHHLTEDGTRWMSDWPIEQRQHDECLKDMKGSVLVGGLGLGYAATVLVNNPRVKQIVVVEISPEVVSLVLPHTVGCEVGGKVNVVTADLFDFLKDNNSREAKRMIFNHAFYDIWRSDGEGTFFEMVVALHKLSRTCVKNRPVCWNEDVMRGQLYTSLLSRMMFITHPEFMKRPDNVPLLWENDGTDSIWHNWSTGYFLWYRNKKLKGDLPSMEEVQEKATLYSGIYGLPGWKYLWESNV